MLPEGNETLMRPAAFDFMPLVEWYAFNRRVWQRAEKLTIPASELEPGVLILADRRQLDLLNVAQLCHLSGPDDWDDLIDEHLDALVAEVTIALPKVSMFDLRIRLVADDRRDRDVLRRLGARPFANGVAETLAVRFRNTVRPLSTSDVEQLGWDLDEAWSSAWAQTRTLEQPEEVSFVDVGGAELVHLYSEHCFGASFLPFIDDLMDDIGTHGALVSIPVRHSLIVHPIHDASMMCAVEAMIPITRQVFRNGPASVSAHLYWWQNGSLTCVPTYFAPDGIEFYPPDELVDVIELFGRLD